MESGGGTTTTDDKPSPSPELFGRSHLPGYLPCYNRAPWRLRSVLEFSLRGIGTFGGFLAPNGCLLLLLMLPLLARGIYFLRRHFCC